MKTPERRAVLLITGVALGLAAAIAATAVYVDRVAPMRVPVVSVGNATIRMRALLLRTLMSGREPLEMLEVLAREEVVRQVAPHPPYNITVADQDVDRYLREQARGTSGSLDDRTFAEWLRQQVNESRFSAREFREQARTSLLMRGLNDYLVERLPTVAAQVHLHMIPVTGLAAARAARERMERGDDFAAVAREASIREDLRAAGGDAGWHVRAALPPYVARPAFDELAVGELSEPLFVDEDTFVIIKVSERSSARTLDEPARLRLRGRALEEWLDAEMARHRIAFHGFEGGYDSNTDAWVKWQLERLGRQDRERPR